MEKVKNKVGRPKLVINETKLQEELKKYLNGEQSGVETYSTLKIGKTSFYAILKAVSYTHLTLPTIRLV